MIHKVFQFGFMELNLDVTQIESIMGYRQAGTNQSFSVLIMEILKECASLNKIRAEYRIYNNIIYDESEATIRINKLVFDINEKVFKSIRGSDSAAVFLCTAGEDIYNRSRMAMKEGDLLKGYIYDIIGSEIVETVADIIQNDLDKELLSAGKRTTNRFSPGYCGWNVEEQYKLFKLVPDNYCGIRLTSSALMDPLKSVSGFMGIGKDVKRHPYSCDFCDMKDCIYRRRKA